MNNNSLKQIFGKFAGQEVPLVEKKYTIGGREYPQLELADPNDKTLAAMQDAAEQNGLSLRVFWPGIFGTTDIRPNRVNVHLEQDSDGKWRVGEDFSIG